jgi:hypothetical protein
MLGEFVLMLVALTLLYYQKLLPILCMELVFWM